MKLNITGHQVEITPAIRSYAEEKVARLKNHFDNHLDVNMILLRSSSKKPRPPFTLPANNILLMQKHTICMQPSIFWSTNLTAWWLK